MSAHCKELLRGRDVHMQITALSHDLIHVHARPDRLHNTAELRGLDRVPPPEYLLGEGCRQPLLKETSCRREVSEREVEIPHI